MSDSADRRKAYVEALREERRGYEARGLSDRIKQVDAAIAALTNEASAKPKAAVRKK